MSLSAHQSGSRQDRKMGRHRILRHGHKPSQFPSRNTTRLLSDEQAKCFKASGLPQGRKSGNCFNLIHKSRILDIYDNFKTFSLTKFQQPPGKQSAIQRSA